MSAREKETYYYYLIWAFCWYWRRCQKISQFVYEVAMNKQPEFQLCSLLLPLSFLVVFSFQLRIISLLLNKPSTSVRICQGWSRGAPGEGQSWILALWRRPLLFGVSLCRFLYGPQPPFVVPQAAFVHREWMKLTQWKVHKFPANFEILGRCHSPLLFNLLS